MADCWTRSAPIQEISEQPQTGIGMDEARDESHRTDNRPVACQQFPSVSVHVATSRFWRPPMVATRLAKGSGMTDMSVRRPDGLDHGRDRR